MAALRLNKYYIVMLMLEKIEGVIKNGQPRDTGNITLEKTEGTIKNRQSRDKATLDTRLQTKTKRRMQHWTEVTDKHKKQHN